ncbi:DNRLRE domain-containing protein [Streptomyces sp. NPDC094032]|uniref:DNRLRE domain-containing protein n=1 Tax=Streptomyces sp. NPDC094032 TaxID=3155308 RepID=UPI00331F13BB
MAVEAALVVGTTGQAVALQSQQESQSAAESSYPTQAADLPSAQVTARLSGKRVEALSERTESSTTWANPDGSVTLDAASGPVRFRDEVTGKWRDIDVDLTKTLDGGIAAKDHPLGLKLAGKTPAAQAAKVRASGPAGEAATSAVPLVTLDAGKDRELGLSWRGALPEPTLSGTTARYPNALTATDLVIESTRTGFEQFLELKNRSAVEANGSVTLTLNAKGIKAQANADRSVTFVDKKSGKQVGLLPAPVMWDAYVDPQSGEHTRQADVGLKLTQRGNQVDLTLTPDAKFLADPQTQFPVTVDPAVNIGPSFDTFVQQGYATDMSSSTELKLGNNGSGQVARSFLAFPMDKILGKQVLSAKLNLWNFHSWSCSPKSWEVWDTGAVSTATRWTAQPSWFNKWATSTSTKGFSSSCADGWVSTDVTSMAKYWVASGNTTNRLGIRATDETDPNGWKRFNSGNAASNTPYMSVTYNTVPGVPTLVSPVPNFPTNDTTPALSAKAVDGDGQPLNLDIEIWDRNGTAWLQAQASGMKPSGTVVTWSPANPLPAGAYKWRSRSYDGTTFSAWAAFRNINIDTTAPAKSTIASTDFPANTWSGTPDANNTFSGAFTFTPPTSDMASVEYKLDSGAWTAAATTGAAVTKTLSFPAGPHTVTVRSKDAAGNVSAESSHVFYAGSGAALLTPGQGERPARRVGLSALGLSVYSGVTYQYRRGETDTWKDVPVADVRQGSDTVSGWPVALSGGQPAGLTWNITDSLAEDGAIELRAAFTDGTKTVYSPVNEITVDRNAGTAPDAEEGPGTVNLLTGNFTLSAADASLFGISVSRSTSSRLPGAGALQDGQAPIFGPQWTSGTDGASDDAGWSYLKKTSTTSVALVDPMGKQLGFTATNSAGWKAEPGAEEMTLTGSLTGSFTLKDTEGVTTLFTKTDSAATSWQASSTTVAGIGQSTTTVISEAVTVDGKKLSRPRLVIAPTSAASVATCSASLTTKGCRALEYVYATTSTATGAAFGDITGQVKEVRGWSTDPGAATATARVVQRYLYDESGRLRETYNPQISPALVTAYAYDEAGRVITLTPPGQLPWSFTYGRAGNAATAGDGMLLNINRSGLQQGTKDVESGTASVSVVYDVPLTGPNAPYQLGVSDVRAWGQTDAPADATAVFPPDAVPATHDGRNLTASDYRRAWLTYTNASGRQVNTAVPGGSITTTEYDRFGNIIRDLSAGNRALALGGTASDQAALTDLGILGLGGQDRAELLSTRSAYDSKGTRKLEELGPLRRTTQIGGAQPITARPWVITEYDTGRPADAKVENQATKVTAGAQALGSRTMTDARVTQTDYDWAKGLPTKTIKDPAGLAITTVTAYDSEGRVSKQLLPGATGTDSATRATTYWSATGTGTCAGRPEWADQVCSTGPAGAIVGGGSNPSQLPTTTTEYDWSGNPTKLVESANGVDRTTVNTFDNAGRLTKSAITGGVGQAVPDTTTEYDLATGQVVKMTLSTGGVIAKEYDRLGRRISYTDSNGGVTRTDYDLLNRPVRITDSAPSVVTYAYDTAAEPRGLVTSTTDSVAGTFSATYDADGSVATEKLPGGLTLAVSEDTAGAFVSRVYTRDSDGAVVYSDNVAESVHGQVTEHAGWSGQDYTYDSTGRLTGVDDTVGDICTRRTYGFDKRANRTAAATVSGTAGAACPATGGSSSTHTYDSADRIVDSGYAYDAFGRTTALPGSQVSYFANDLVQQQTTGTQRQTWRLDPGYRFGSWTVEENTDGVWSQSAAKTNHYGDDSDNPRWVTEDVGDGSISRNVGSATGDFAAVTSGSGDTVLQLTNIHGDVALQLPLDTSDAPLVLDNDEYGNTRTGRPSVRYDWLGGKQRSSETLTGLVLMGVRLYNPDSGRFLSQDPFYGGNANAYEYCYGEPVNCTDLSGQWSYTTWRAWWAPYHHIKIYTTRSEAGWLAFTAGAVGQLLGVVASYLNGPLKLAVTLARYYAWYIASVSGYAWKRGKGVVIYSYVSLIPAPHAAAPTVWPRGGW